MGFTLSMLLQITTNQKSDKTMRKHIIASLQNLQQSILKTKIQFYVFQCFFSLLMLSTSNVFALINYFSQTLWLSVGASVVGMLWLRRTRPDIPRPIRVNIVVPYLFLIAIACLVIIPAIDKPTDSAIGVAILLSGIPVYYLCVKWETKPDSYHVFSGYILRFFQKLCSCIYVESTEKMSQ